MNDKQKNRLIPKLRFPDFKDSGKWEVEPLGSIYTFKTTNSFSRSKLNNENGTIKNIHYGDIHTKFSTLFDINKENVPYINSDVFVDRISQDNYCTEGDIIFADASEDLDDVGKSIEIINLNNEKLLSGLHTFLARQIEKKLIIGFGGYLFKSDAIRNQIKNEAQGAKVLGISKGRISNIKICYPKNKKEQQKIASCLSSLDELLEAHKQKLELLKKHKKGLMQNLFPHPSAGSGCEKVPKLRFPEFKDGGEWVEKKLGEVGKIVTGTTPSTKKYEYYENGIYPWVTPTDISEQKDIYSTKKLLSEKGLEAGRFIPKNSLLVTCIASIGKNAILRKDGSCNQQINAIIPNTNNNVDFLYYLIENNTNVLLSNAGQGGMAILNKSDFSNIKLSFPQPAEQQKVAECLSSLDELIAAEAEKIGQLEKHKKGLMQGLFPSIV